MRTLAPELPVAATRPLGAALAPTPIPAPAAAALSFPWDETAQLVAASREEAFVAGAVAAAARHLGVDGPAAGTPVVVLQRVFGRLHRAAVGGATVTCA